MNPLLATKVESYSRYAGSLYCIKGLNEAEKWNAKTLQSGRVTQRKK